MPVSLLAEIEEDKTLALMSEDVGDSLRSLQTLLESLDDEVETLNSVYTTTDVKKLFYSDGEDAYESGEKEEEEEYPTMDTDAQKKMGEKAKKLAERKENEIEKDEIKNSNYQKSVSAAKRALTLGINNMNYHSDRAFESIVIENPANTTVYNSLVSTALSNGLNIEVREYGAWGGGGLYIESINGIKNGQNGYFWEYVVNGKIPDVSVDKCQTHAGDIVEWRLLKKQNSGCGG